MAEPPLSVVSRPPKSPLRRVPIRLGLGAHLGVSTRQAALSASPYTCRRPVRGRPPETARDVDLVAVPKSASPPLRKCLTCRSRKVKCSGTVPCAYCSKRGLACHRHDPGERRFYSVEKIRDLEARLARFENRARRDDADGGKDAGSQEDLLGSRSPVLTLQRTQYTIPADAALSSSNNFGSRVSQLLGSYPWAHRPSNPERPPPVPNRYNEAIPPLPDEAHARRLVDAVLFYVGQTQSHFDPRLFFDRMDLYYAHAHDSAQACTPWFLEMLVVFALGKLFISDFAQGRDHEQGLPGSQLFEFALSNLPNLGQLYAQGTLGVEILALIALYLQNVDRQAEAYIHISTALRLAITHGYHKKAGVTHLLLSEKVQLNRLWWTVYMQDRRLAAATGNPYGIQDEAIDLDLPPESLGFGPAAPLRLNMEIARITGRITGVLYGDHDRTEHDFVSKVQEIIRSLSDISRHISSKISTDVRAPADAQVARTSASLQLMLLQATLLTIRPIMLHVTRLILSGNFTGGGELVTSSLGKLSRTCSEAARRLLGVVVALKERNILAIFGFFDCDATCSAAFVMILTAIFDSACPGEQKMRSSASLADAVEILQHMASNGNRHAIQRLQEVRRVWSHIEPHLHERWNATAPVPNASQVLPSPRAAPVTDVQVTERSIDDLESQRHPPPPPPPPQQQHHHHYHRRQSSVSAQIDASASDWFNSGIRDAERGGYVALDSELGHGQTVLPSALWDDISQLWLPLGEFNDGLFHEGNGIGEETEDSQTTFLCICLYAYAHLH
ncbi:uncharacterized protein B0I36DRAFT_364339 [Microdochium trichocladiopsis]|uniref:Zn(2)-C6 fungal-type domain-containing protein n=1 Tax=Microdochium trichocladiopsis TaxID=1682393 RepID=A0A9P8Y549_9PEZI|nr:uncharacterized protein B0I36DRAFT_364339 [Microdochium trichocladiopsis]KAH7029866.1 hypothetical protein B0I36DRAFT_364339 [Microdochium trichocladiopsis]